MFKNVTVVARNDCALIAYVALIVLSIGGCVPDATRPPVLADVPDPRRESTDANAENADANVKVGSDADDGESETSTVASVSQNPTPEIQERSIWEGVYTEEQSRRGEVAYTEACVRCHGKELEGDDVVPELVGEGFLERWSRKRAGNLFVFMLKEMPLKAEARLTPVEYAEVLAYILRENLAPFGKEELPSNFEALQGIRMNKAD